MSCFPEIDDAFWRSAVDTQHQKFGVVLSKKGRQKDLGFSIARNCTLRPESSAQKGDSVTTDSTLLGLQAWGEADCWTERIDTTFSFVIPTSFKPKQWQ